MNGFSEKSRAGLIAEAEEGENIYPPNIIVQNVFDTKKLVLDVYEYSVKIIFQNNHYQKQCVFLKAVKCLFKYDVENKL